MYTLEQLKKPKLKSKPMTSLLKLKYDEPFNMFEAQILVKIDKCVTIDSDANDSDSDLDVVHKSKAKKKKTAASKESKILPSNVKLFADLYAKKVVTSSLVQQYHIARGLVQPRSSSLYLRSHCAAIHGAYGLSNDIAITLKKKKYTSTKALQQMEVGHLEENVLQTR
ncbi:hypothetical protein FISHEDRAFT_57481 [Fistulina hepatica ATCC 64428]|uniref:Uncharacterized protein n=1 Tax=Fistulina hepatica ATCC 64428 TaxID=1128425 RepID=A0A0D7AGZ9_9AGAR|nr:hypothetical protein FISHEDRAFT_57481 [Fistulina hepatica ATCC 64428]